jgi:hypothetical protein
VIHAGANGSGSAAASGRRTLPVRPVADMDPVSTLQRLRVIYVPIDAMPTALCAAAGSMDADLSFLSFLERRWADVSERRMPARWIVEALDVVEHVGPRLIA